MHFPHPRLISALICTACLMVAGTGFAATDAMEKALPLLSLSIMLTLLVAIISIFGVIYLYLQQKKQKTIIPKNNSSENIDTLKQSIEKLQNTITAHIKASENQTGNSQPSVDNGSSSSISEKIDDLSKTFLTLKKNLDERDIEIKRLKSGYDAEIFRRFLHRFIRVDQTIEEFIEEPGDLSTLQLLLEDALEECGVEKFSPELNTDYRKAYGVADHPGIVDTDDLKKDFMIAEIETSGYKLTNNEANAIVKAKVKIFKTQKERI